MTVNTSPKKIFLFSQCALADQKNKDVFKQAICMFLEEEKKYRFFFCPLRCLADLFILSFHFKRKKILMPASAMHMSDINPNLKTWVKS